MGDFKNMVFDAALLKQMQDYKSINPMTSQEFCDRSIGNLTVETLMEKVKNKEIPMKIDEDGQKGFMPRALVVYNLEILFGFEFEFEDEKIEEKIEESVELN